jgi:N-acetylneuraminic acid mutarotase
MPDSESHRTAEKLRSLGPGVSLAVIGRAIFLFCVLLPRVGISGDPAIDTYALPDLPLASSNNAVASITLGDNEMLVSLMGLSSGKTWKEAHGHAFAFKKGEPGWSQLKDVPGPGGRLAGTAIGVGSFVYIFGGYTVAENGEEVSVDLVQRLDPVSGDYSELASMTVPVDDAVSLLWRDRYIYLVSGWHDSGNVNLVQVYDILKDRWFQATPYPGRAVFGHAGGIVGPRLVICDGVAIQTRQNPPRAFEAVDACYHGQINEDDPSRIEWTRLPGHGGSPLYRMGSVGSARLGMVVFVGGSDNPYNYNGIGYDGVPSQASSRVFGFDLRNNAWAELGHLPFGVMDLRGLPEFGDQFIVVGGMRQDQQVTSNVVGFGISTDR